jgi:hypothetical protein
MDESLNIGDLAMHMHDSFQTIDDRIKKIETKVKTNGVFNLTKKNTMEKSFNKYLKNKNKRWIQ